MKIRLILLGVGGLVLMCSLFACGGDKPPMVPDQDQPATADAGAD